MTVQLKKVEGGYELVIPDEVATQLGFSETEAVELLVLSPNLLIWSPTFKKVDRERAINSITPENRHEEVDWGPPVGKERFWEGE